MTERITFFCSKSELCGYKLRYLDMLQDEGCLNEILYDKPEWDDCLQRLSLVELEGLIPLVPDDVIARQFEELNAY